MKERGIAMKYLLGLDIETANSQRTSACCAGLYLKEIGGTNLINEFVLINPESRFNFLHSEMHGIKAKDVEHADPFPAFHEKLKAILEKYPDTLIVTHNATVNIAVYYACCVKYGIEPLAFPFLSTAKLAKFVLLKKESYSLPYLCEYFNLPGFKRYFALDEAKMSVLLLEKMMNVIGVSSIPEMVNYSKILLGQMRPDGYSPCAKQTGGSGGQSAAQTKKTRQLPDSPRRNESSPVYGKKFALSKAHKILPRKRAATELLELGGILSDILTRDCDYYVYDMEPNLPKTSKVLKIEEWNAKGCHVQIISEREFLKMLGLIEG